MPGTMKFVQSEVGSGGVNLYIIENQVANGRPYGNPRLLGLYEEPADKLVNVVREKLAELFPDPRGEGTPPITAQDVASIRMALEAYMEDLAIDQAVLSFMHENGCVNVTLETVRELHRTINHSGPRPRGNSVEGSLIDKQLRLLLGLQQATDITHY